MVDEAKDNAAEATVKAETSEPNWKELYQKLQPKFEKSKKREKELAVQVAEFSVEGSGTLSRLEEKVEAIAGVLAKADLLGEHGKILTDAVTASGQKKRLTEQHAKAWGEVQGLLSEGDAEWGEERFAPARALFTSGNYSEAIGQVRQLVTPTKPDVDISALVEKKVQEKMKQIGKVDTGETTASSAKKAVTYEEFRRMSPDDRIKNKAAFETWMQQSGGR